MPSIIYFIWVMKNSETKYLDTFSLFVHFVPFGIIHNKNKIL